MWGAIKQIDGIQEWLARAPDRNQDERLSSAHTAAHEAYMDIMFALEHKASYVLGHPFDDKEEEVLNWFSENSQEVPETQVVFVARRDANEALNLALQAIEYQATDILGYPLGVPPEGPYTRGLLEKRLAQLDRSVIHLRDVRGKGKKVLPHSVKKIASLEATVQTRIMEFNKAIQYIRDLRFAIARAAYSPPSPPPPLPAGPPPRPSPLKLKAPAEPKPKAKPKAKSSPPKPEQEAKRPYGVNTELAQLKRQWHGHLTNSERKKVESRLRELGFEPDSRKRKAQEILLLKKPPSPRSIQVPKLSPAERKKSPPRPPPKSPPLPLPAERKKSPPVDRKKSSPADRKNSPLRLPPPLQAESKALASLHKPNSRSKSRSLSRSFTDEKRGRGAAGQNALDKPVIILFLAHAGVTQPTAWQTWKSSAPKGKILFVVHSNPGIYEEDAFARKYGILEAKDRIPVTKWCHKSLVFAQQAGIRYILKHWPSVAMIYLVSGDSVPIREARELLTLPNESRFCGSQRLSADIWKLTKTEWNCLKRTTAPRQGDRAALEITARDFYEHEQWLSLNGPDAQVISKFDFKRFDQVDKYFGSRQFHLRTSERAKLRSVHSDEGYEKHSCPDEYYFGTALSSWRGYKRPEQKCLMYAFRANVTEPSPVIWTHWRPICVANEDKEGWLSKITLLQAATIARESGAFFFRKVGNEDQIRWPSKFKYDGSAQVDAPIWKRATGSQTCKPVPPSGKFQKWSTVEMCPEEPVVASETGIKNKKQIKLKSRAKLTTAARGPRLTSASRRPRLTSAAR